MLTLFMAASVMVPVITVKSFFSLPPSSFPFVSAVVDSFALAASVAALLSLSSPSWPVFTSAVVAAALLSVVDAFFPQAKIPIAKSAASTNPLFLIFNLLELYAFDGNLSILMFLYAIFLCDKNEAKAFLTLTIQEEEEEI